MQSRHFFHTCFCVRQPGVRQREMHVQCAWMRASPLVWSVRVQDVRGRSVAKSFDHNSTPDGCPPSSMTVSAPAKKSQSPATCAHVRCLICRSPAAAWRAAVRPEASSAFGGEREALAPRATLPALRQRNAHSGPRHRFHRAVSRQRWPPATRSTARRRCWC